MQSVRWSHVRLRAGLVLLITFSVCVSRFCEALSFDPKRLESSSQLWAGYHPSVKILSTSFEDSTPQNVSTLVGESAFLPCTVYHLGDRSVTWMRKRDLHILTAGIYTYSADERFVVLHPENSNDWTLHIRFVTLRDAGVYECQVNSDPKISRRVILNVIENQLDDPGPYGVAVTDTRFPDYKFDYDERQQRPHKKKKKKKVPVVMIDGLEERHIQRGSILSITCVVRHPPKEAPEHVLWFHGATNIDYDSPRGGVSIQTKKSSRKTVSKLMLSAVDQSDTGAYSCSPTALQPAEVTVHVQDGTPWPTSAFSARGEPRAPRLVCGPPARFKGQIQQPVKQGLGYNEAPRVAASSTSLVLLAIVTQLCNSNWNLFG
ncbi:zwei Ig domain protein zig-8-like isoform X2 [Eriocheir sinensis]|uniref:zwei Ig domain protein zig-8-like isoform X2 n=1 Tax=Eriocheir sinensis TaxID=95602 RepID=UPI0021C71902|nr:zwei Ig domain protein zig-8-like isoform X2 [Eriocheir sinensis]